MKIIFFSKSFISLLLLFSVIACENKNKSPIIHENKVKRHGHSQIHKNNKIFVIAGLTKKLPLNSIEISIKIGFKLVIIEYIEFTYVNISRKNRI